MIIPSPLPCSYGSHRCLHIQEEEEERTKTFLRRSPSLIGGTSRGGVPQQPASQPAEHRTVTRGEWKVPPLLGSFGRSVLRVTSWSCIKNHIITLLRPTPSNSSSSTSWRNWEAPSNLNSISNQDLLFTTKQPPAL